MFEFLLIIFIGIWFCIITLRISKNRLYCELTSVQFEKYYSNLYQLRVSLSYYNQHLENQIHIWVLLEIFQSLI